MEKKTIEPYPLLMPVPAAVVSIADDEADNLITISWIGVVCSEPPMIGFSVRKNRRSFEMLQKAKDFVVNIPAKENLEIVDICGRKSGKDFDKTNLRGAKLIESKLVHSKMIKEFPVNIECKLVKSIELGSHTQFIGEVVATHVDPVMVDDSGNIMVGVVNPACYIPKAGMYFKLSTALEKAGFAEANIRSRTEM